MLKIVIPFALPFLMFVIGMAQAVAQDGNHNTAVPTVFMQENGLDPAGNPIDRLLSIYGPCSKILRQYTGRCKTEDELSRLVDTLPHDARGLSEALTALGARCSAQEKQQIQVDCVIQKKVQHVGWVYGQSEPVAITNENFAIHIIVEFDQGIMRHQVEVKNTSTKAK
jgi:hypothetical protein